MGPSPRPVAKPKFKRSVFPAICLFMDGEQLDSFPKGSNAMLNANNLVKYRSPVAVSISYNNNCNTINATPAPRQKKM